ncbi:MAG TPA: cation:proton antiporter [Lacipirellulaceae bacterium]|jgi:CPA2 family monovalent cation:H+ antiporter-2|nr:cation:proton antiporter [Lacipirellulaceae bacterium]
MHEAHLFLQTLALVLCTAAVTTVLFQKLHQPVVLGYLLAGMVVGPHLPGPEADDRTVQTLAEVGVILLMFSLGIEFSLSKLMRVGPTAGFVAVLQCSLMVWLGYLVGQAFGWSQLQSLYAGAVISISSTTIIIKAFEEQRIKADFTHIVFGILIVEDLIAILLITILTALSAGEELTAMEVVQATGRLAAFLVSMLVIGLLTVPRLMRFVVRLDRSETTVVASVGLAFGFAVVADTFEYSVALGAFIAGSLVAESGVEKTIEHVVQPVRDIFAAIFFVSVGMLINPRDIAENWPIVLVFLVVVVVGKIASVTLGAFLTGESVQTSVKTGMSLAQIGEFSFIIAGVGMARGVTDNLLYSIAVAVSGITTLFTPWLIRAAQPTAAWVDKKSPRALQTFGALYSSWLEQLRSSSADGQTNRIRRSIRWLIVDVVLVAAIIIGASMEMERIADFVEDHLDLPERWTRVAVVAGAAILSAPFLIGMVRTARFLGFELAGRVFPVAEANSLDLAAAPRRLLVVTLQLAIVLSIGLPLVAITQPFVPPLRGAAVLLFVLLLLAFAFWRGATNFQGHTRAAAQALAESLTRQTREGRAAGTDHKIDEANKIFAGLGSPVPVELQPSSPAIGKTLAQIRLRGLTGATVLAIRRGEHSVLIPSGEERLLEGDVLAIAGSKDAIHAAKQVLGDQQVAAADPGQL